MPIAPTIVIAKIVSKTALAKAADRKHTPVISANPKIVSTRVAIHDIGETKPLGKNQLSWAV
jgi:hypothetical protein